jgi:hypothetical protein
MDTRRFAIPDPIKPDPVQPPAAPIWAEPDAWVTRRAGSGTNHESAEAGKCVDRPCHSLNPTRHPFAKPSRCTPFPRPCLPVWTFFARLAVLAGEASQAYPREPQATTDWIWPVALKSGDTIAFVAPAGDQSPVTEPNMLSFLLPVTRVRMSVTEPPGAT